MPRTGPTYTLPESPFVPNTVISSSAMNSDMSDIATALTGSLARDGAGGMLGQLLLDPDGFVYVGDTNTGMSRTGADAQAITVGGTDVVAITTTGVAITGTLSVSGSAGTVGFGDGTVSVPSITFSADLDNGLYRIGTNNIGVATAGAKVLDISAIGLGVTGTITSSGAATVTSGGLTVTAGGLVVSSGAVSFPSGYYASQTDQESATSTTAPVTPGVQKYHPGHPKAWVYFNSSGTIQASYNVASVVRNSTGLYTITWTTSFSSAAYAILTSAFSVSGQLDVANIISLSAGSCQIAAVRNNVGAFDNSLMISAFGDQ